MMGAAATMANASAILNEHAEREQQQQQQAATTSLPASVSPEQRDT